MGSILLSESSSDKAKARKQAARRIGSKGELDFVRETSGGAEDEGLKQKRQPAATSANTRQSLPSSKRRAGRKGSGWAAGGKL